MKKEIQLQAYVNDVNNTIEKQKRQRSVIWLAPLFLLTIFFLSACDHTESDWQKSNERGTIDAYLAFERKYPKSDHITESSKRRKERVEYLYKRGNDSDIINEILRNNPDDAIALNNLAVFKAKNMEFEEAKKLFEAAKVNSNMHEIADLVEVIIISVEKANGGSNLIKFAACRPKSYDNSDLESLFKKYGDKNFFIPAGKSISIVSQLTDTKLPQIIERNLSEMAKYQMNDNELVQTLNARKMAVEDNRKEGEAFLAENKKKEGVVTLPSGLQYKILKAGEGKKPTAADMVEVHYRGTLINGTEFDSSLRRGRPITFKVPGVIAGWQEGLKLMPVGSKWQLFIPSQLAYGEKGAGKEIGPNSTLVFEVELLAIK